MRLFSKIHYIVKIHYDSCDLHQRELCNKKCEIEQALK